MTIFARDIPRPTVRIPSLAVLRTPELSDQKFQLIPFTSLAIDISGAANAVAMMRCAPSHFSE